MIVVDVGRGRGDLGIKNLNLEREQSASRQSQGKVFDACAAGLTKL